MKRKRRRQTAPPPYKVSVKFTKNKGRVDLYSTLKCTSSTRKKKKTQVCCEGFTCTPNKRRLVGSNPRHARVQLLKRTYGSRDEAELALSKFLKKYNSEDQYVSQRGAVKRLKLVDPPPKSTRDRSGDKEVPCTN